MYRGWASNVQLPACTLGKALILRPPTSGTSRGLCPHSLGSTGGRHGDEDGPRAVRTAGRGLHRIAGVRGAGSGLLGLRRLHRERGARPSEVAAARGLPVRARASRGGARPPRKSPRGARPRSGVGAPAPRAAGGSAPGRRARTPAGGGDRKSTRLNSSHGYISYAVFCLEKKKKKRNRPNTISNPHTDTCPSL